MLDDGLRERIDDERVGEDSMFFMIDPKPVTVYTFVGISRTIARSFSIFEGAPHGLEHSRTGHDARHPAAGMEVALYTTEGDAATLVKRFTLNSDGRSDGPLYDNAA
jgi:hypothetical protein